jgi:hypothetical protein
MKVRIFMKFLQKFIFLAVGLMFLSVIQSTASANETEFLNTLQQLEKNGVIPWSDGKVTSYGSFTDSYTNMGSAKFYSITEADHYVLSSKISWLSASATPNSAVSGCGYIFSSDSNANDYITTTIRMNGYIYFNGLKNGNKLSYGQQYIMPPSMQGEGLLTLVVNNSSVSIYFNGKQLFTRNDVVISGDKLGFAVLSGTNKDYGTQCTFEDIFLYTWQDQTQ